MAWTEDGFERHVLAPRRILRLRMAELLDRTAETAGGDAHLWRRHADTLRHGDFLAGAALDRER